MNYNRIVAIALLLLAAACTTSRPHREPEIGSIMLPCLPSIEGLRVADAFRLLEIRTREADPTGGGITIILPEGAEFTRELSDAELEARPHHEMKYTADEVADTGKLGPNAQAILAVDVVALLANSMGVEYTIRGRVVQVRRTQ